MNSKAIKKQLLAAVAMVLVAAVALGSSTYAWFVASGSVTAKGMKVQAQAEGGLAIRYGTGDWGITATAGMPEAKTLLPASTKNMTAWSYAKASSAKEYNADTTTRKDITTDVLGTDKKTYNENNQYVVMKEFQIRSTADSPKALGLFVSNVTVTAGGQNPEVNQSLSTALRVGVRYEPDSTVGNAKSYIYGPVKIGDKTDAKNIPTGTYNWYQDNTDTNGTPVTLDEFGTKDDTKSQLVAQGTPIAFENSKCVKVQVFIWFEGEDKNLYSENFSAEDLNVTVEFSSYGFQTA